MKIEQLEEFIDRPSPQAGARMRIATPALIRVAKAAAELPECEFVLDLKYQCHPQCKDGCVIDHIKAALAELEEL